MAGFRGLLELMGLWPSVPSVPPAVGCVAVTVFPLGTVTAYDLAVASADIYDLAIGTVTIELEGC